MDYTVKRQLGAKEGGSKVEEGSLVSICRARVLAESTRHRWWGNWKMSPEPRQVAETLSKEAAELPTIGGGAKELGRGKGESEKIKDWEAAAGETPSLRTPEEACLPGQQGTWMPIPKTWHWSMATGNSHTFIYEGGKVSHIFQLSHPNQIVV